MKYLTYYQVILTGEQFQLLEKFDSDIDIEHHYICAIVDDCKYTSIRLTVAIGDQRKLYIHNQDELFQGLLAKVKIRYTKKESDDNK